VRTFNLIFISAALGLALSSCQSAPNINTKEAVRKAVVDHLSARKGLDLDMNAMDLDIGEMSFKPDEAEAMVSFRPKGSQAAAMSMKYSLVRDGAGWKVKPKAPGAPAAAEGAGGANPHGMAAPSPIAPGAQMPPGHPPLEGKK
jgi:hypothetical protein